MEWNKALPIPKVDSSKMPEVQELERLNLHNQQWTMTNEQSGLSSIFNGESPFHDGGQLETLDGHPEGAAIPNLPDAPQEFASGLDSELKSKVQNMSMNKSTKL